MGGLVTFSTAMVAFVCAFSIEFKKVPKTLAIIYGIGSLTIVLYFEDYFSSQYSWVQYGVVALTFFVSLAMFIRIVRNREDD